LETQLAEHARDVVAAVGEGVEVTDEVVGEGYIGGGEARDGEDGHRGKVEVSFRGEDEVAGYVVLVEKVHHIGC